MERPCRPDDPLAPDAENDRRTTRTETHKEAAIRAASFTENDGPLTIEDVEPTAPGPRDVVVADRRERRLPLRPLPDERHVGRMPGTILGHEGAGTMLEVGAEVTKVKAGDRVIASFIPACGTCWFCLHDESNLCDNELAVMMTMRGSRPDGGRTGDDRARHVRRQMTCNESSLVKVDTDLPDEQLALIGCGVTTGVGAALNTANVSRARPSPSSAAAASARPSSRARASPARRASSPSTRSS